MVRSAWNHYRNQVPQRNAVVVRMKVDNRFLIRNRLQNVWLPQEFTRSTVCKIEPLTCPFHPFTLPNTFPCHRWPVLIGSVSRDVWMSSWRAKSVNERLTAKEHKFIRCILHLGLSPGLLLLLCVFVCMVCGCSCVLSVRVCLSVCTRVWESLYAVRFQHDFTFTAISLLFCTLTRAPAHTSAHNHRNTHTTHTHTQNTLKAKENLFSSFTPSK